MLDVASEKRLMALFEKYINSQTEGQVHEEKDSNSEITGESDIVNSLNKTQLPSKAS